MKVNNRTHSAVVRLGFGAFVFLVLAPIVSLSQNAGIEWELVNPFPFIQDETKMAELRAVYRGLDGTKSAFDLERNLQRNDEETVDRRRKEVEAACLADGKTPKECDRASKLPYLGWFSSLAIDRHSGTCWNSSSLKFRDNEDRCKGYPRTAPPRKIRAWIEGVTDAEIAAAQWSKDGSAVSFASVDCPEGYPSKKCVVFDQPADTDFSLSAVLPSGQTPTTGTVRAHEKLVVGLGDSYGSGEGNPDRPAQFMRNQSDRDLWWFWKWRRVPRRDLNDITLPNKPIINVEWLDRRCHRSMYSYQFKTALHLALQNPKQAVTYVSYACSGATTHNIHLPGSEQKPQEDMLRNSLFIRNGGKKPIELQLAALKNAIGDRKIDLLLLSTGGNDLGFAAYVADIVLSGKTRWIAGLVKQSKKPEEGKTKSEIETNLTKNYLDLRKAIFKDYGLNVNGCNGDGPCDRIVLTPYPNAFRDEKGQLCTVTKNEFSMPFNRDNGRELRMRKAFDYLFTHLASFQKSASALEQNGRALGWKIASDDLEAWNRHGFCAQADPLGDVNDRFITPQRKNWEWRAYRPTGNAEFSRDDRGIFDPREYKTYGARTRWIRLPIDSKLTADQRSFLWKFSHDFLFKDDRSSVMHPTAEAHAATADMNLAKIKTLQ